jgi:TonB family protein
VFTAPVDCRGRTVTDVNRADTSMRNRLRLRLDPYDYSLLGGTHEELPQSDPSEHRVETSLSKLASALPAAGGAPSTDLALDLVLNEIAELARVSTNAAGVAIALTRSGELVCRATTGSAPDMGIRLNPHAGLSGLCLQTKSVQLCDDTESDSRVDSEACRGLRARSILVVPIRKKETVLGLLEAFAPDANHFREHDIATLESFCRQIVNEIDHSIKASSVPKLPVSIAPEDSKVEPVNSRRFGSMLRSYDRSTLFLTCAIIATALVLGWTLGRTDKRQLSGSHLARTDGKLTHVNDSPQSESIQKGIPANSVATTSDGPPESVSRQTNITKSQVKKIAPGLSESKNRSAASSDGGLVVSQNGKVLFREGDGQSLKATKADSEAPVEQPGRIVPAGKTTLLTQDAANDYLTYRVAPQYPEVARQEHIQGPVLLRVMVGKDGGVQQIQLLSGDQKLAAAASTAVVQWRFKPLLRAGQPVEFETQITVDFKLP